MKLIASGVANCAAIVEVALVLAVRVVDDDDHAALADLLDRLLDRRERRGHGHGRQASARAASRRTSRARRPRGSPGRPARASPSVVAASVCGISATAKPVVVERGDGEARALDRDRALLDARSGGARRARRPRSRLPVAFGLDAADGADAVDVALDVVAAERRRRRAAPARG